MFVMAGQQREARLRARVHIHKIRKTVSEYMSAFPPKAAIRRSDRHDR
jgi:hypothetical protein